MDRVQQAALLTQFIHLWHHHGHRCGEAFLQKGVYLVQEWAAVPLGYDFLLYKHAPFSKGLQYELTALRADGLVRLDLQEGLVQVALTPQASYLQSRYPAMLAQHRQAMDTLAARLKGTTLFELECMSTAWYLKNRAGVSWDGLAEYLVSKKPHIALAEAYQAVKVIKAVGQLTSLTSPVG